MLSETGLHLWSMRALCLLDFAHTGPLAGIAFLQIFFFLANAFLLLGVSRTPSFCRVAALDSVALGLSACSCFSKLLKAFK